jgi:ubiquinone/menaquinone biosynthesis C-methylase UbiE
MKSHEYLRNFEIENRNWWFVGVRKMVHRLIKRSGIGTIYRCLDIGCGTGALLKELTPLTEELWGLDLAPPALSYCVERGFPEDHLILGTADNTPFNDNYFDVITAIGIIEHLDDDDKFLKEVYRILRPGGVLILLTSSFAYLWSEHDEANQHKRRYFLKNLEGRLRANHFETITFSHFNFFLFPVIAPILLLNRLFRKKDREARRIMPRPPWPINQALIQLLSLESFLMSLVRFPWGISMIGSFRKKL